MTDIDITQAMSEAEARRKAADEERQQSEKTELNALVGDLLLDTQTMLGNNELDYSAKLGRLRGADAAINGAAGTMPAQPSLSDDEQQVLDAYRSRRLVKTDQGAYRDTEWSKLHPRPVPQAAKAAEPVPATPPTPAAKAKSEPPAKSDSGSTAATTDDTTDEPKVGFLDSALERGKQFWKNAKQ